MLKEIEEKEKLKSKDESLSPQQVCDSIGSDFSRQIQSPESVSAEKFINNVMSAVSQYIDVKDGATLKNVANQIFMELCGKKMKRVSIVVKIQANDVGIDEFDVNLSKLTKELIYEKYDAKAKLHKGEEKDHSYHVRYGGYELSDRKIDKIKEKAMKGEIDSVEMTVISNVEWKLSDFNKRKVFAIGVNEDEKNESPKKKIKTEDEKKDK